MAHFAQLDSNNMVVNVIVISNDDIDNKEFPESEAIGLSFLDTLYPDYKNWKQTSYNANFRKNYAGIGFKYDSLRDAFIPPKPFPSWIFVEETCKWKAPVDYPTDGQLYVWDEFTTSWKV